MFDFKLRGLAGRPDDAKRRLPVLCAVLCAAFAAGAAAESAALPSEAVAKPAHARGRGALAASDAERSSIIDATRASRPRGSATASSKIVLAGGNRCAAHVQGVCTDGRSIYWSMTYDLFKTDLEGRELAHYANRDFHMGDLCFHAGRVYVGINRGAAAGCRRGDEVWVFETNRLERVRVIPTPQTVWCNNGIEWFGDRFWIISAAPTRSRYNFVFEYTGDFRFVQCRPIESGWTNLGVQTICLKDGVMYFGCYGAGDDAEFPHRSCTFGVDVKDLTRPSRNAEFPYVVPIGSRFDSWSAEGMLVLDGRMWTAHGTSRVVRPAKTPGGRPERLYGAYVAPETVNFH